VWWDLLYALFIQLYLWAYTTDLSCKLFFSYIGWFSDFLPTVFCHMRLLLLFIFYLVSWSRLVHKLLLLLPLQWHWFGMHILFGCIILHNAATRIAFNFLEIQGFVKSFYLWPDQQHIVVLGNSMNLVLALSMFSVKIQHFTHSVNSVLPPNFCVSFQWIQCSPKFCVFL
jgi:hypothetical protein